MMKPLLYMLTTVLLILSVWGNAAEAQRLNFSVFGDELTVKKKQDLDFNEKQPIIVVGESEIIEVELTDPVAQMAVVRIVAVKDFDITVEITPPPNNRLLLDGTEDNEGTRINYNLRWAYSNSRQELFSDAKNHAQLVPDGFFSATFPINRRLNTSGPPGPPPTPADGDTSQEMETAYLFIFGTLGPVGNVQVGEYSGEVQIHVSYTDNQPN